MWRSPPPACLWNLRRRPQKLLWSEWSRHRSYYSSEDEGQKAEKRRKFEEHRKKHYQMSSEAREALHR